MIPELSLEELITLHRRIPPARPGAVLNIPLRTIPPPNPEDMELKSIEFPTLAVHAEPYESPRHGVHFRWAIQARIHFVGGLAHQLDETQTLSKAEVMRALLRIGLGGKLVNACLVELGYTLSPFPTAPSSATEGRP